MDEHQDIEGAAATNGSVSGASHPVLAGTEARAIEPARPTALSAPVVVATGGALVAAIGYMLLRVLRRPARSRGSSVRVGRGRRRESLEVTASRSFLVDVHMLKR